MTALLIHCKINCLFCDNAAGYFDYGGGEHQVGCDLVEVSPPYDTTGNTSLTAGCIYIRYITNLLRNSLQVNDHHYQL